MTSVYVFFFVILPLELTSRAYFSLRGQTSFWWPDLPGVFYGELRESGVFHAPETRHDDTFDLLLLGGSVVWDEFGNVDDYLARRLTQELEKTVKIYNLARSGHSSRDSLNKYLHLTGKRFDLVLFYHGINDARLNNVPPDSYRLDYTHASWYARIDALERHPEAPAFTLPYALHFLWIKLGERTGLTTFISRHAPADGWLEYGAKVRSKESFKANVASLVTEAHLRGDPLALVTFATYLPPNYDFDRPHDGQRDGVNDYSDQGTSLVELWGRARHVTEAVKQHNAVLRGFAVLPDVPPNVVLVDIDQEFPRQGSLFDDITHLSDSGQRVFVDIIAAAIVDRIRSTIEM